MTVAKETISDAEEDWVVAPAGRLVVQVAHAVEVEERLDDQGTTEHRGDVQADHRDDGEHGVAQGVDEDNAELRQALRTGGAHVLLVEVVHHGGAHVARVGGDRSNREGAHGRIK